MTLHNRTNYDIMNLLDNKNLSSTGRRLVEQIILELCKQSQEIVGHAPCKLITHVPPLNCDDRPVLEIQAKLK